MAKTTNTQTLIPGKEKLQLALTFLKNDPVFALSFALAILSCFFARPEIEYINFEVLACLFNLMIVVKAFEELRLLDKIAVGILNRCTNSRRVSLIMILLSFFSSMIITNDIALITLVPLTLVISRKSDMNVMGTVILQTLAANIGSSLTPIGNPQNLYIFSYYELPAAQFFPVVGLFALLGLAWLCVLNLSSTKIDFDITLETIEIKEGRKAAIWAVLFIIIVLSIFDVVSYQLVFLVTVVLTFIINKKLFKKVDYLLLATFICFFIFIGNVSSIPAIAGFMEGYLSSAGRTYFSSIILSQVVSNVPCAIFLSKFNSDWRELLLGVNIGGMGTIIASLASVISYKIYAKENPGSSGKYMVQFSMYNALSLMLFTVINYALLFLR